MTEEEFRRQIEDDWPSADDESNEMTEEQYRQLVDPYWDTRGKTSPEVRYSQNVEEFKVTEVNKADPDLAFPYKLSDLVGWAVKHKDGMIVKYSLMPKPSKRSSVTRETVKALGPANVSSFPSQTAPFSQTVHMSNFCNHDPALLPTFKSGNLNLFIADGYGMKKHKDEFNLVIDCGDVLNLYKDIYTEPEILTGDEDLIEDLAQYVTTIPCKWPRVLKIDWADRKAPPLAPEFWVKLAESLGKDAKKAGKQPFDVVINCQGGHGRSGTAMVCLMMVLNPEYGASQAITHLRAIHCARAIESIDQHNYIDSVATYLGQSPDSAVARAVTNYRDAFGALKLKSAKVYQERLKGQADGK